MLKQTTSIFALCLLAAACGDQGTSTVSQPVPAADIDSATLCQYADPAARGDYRLAGEEVSCTIEQAGEMIAISGLAGAEGMPVSFAARYVYAPGTVELSADMLAPVSTYDAEHGVYTNVHGVFVVSAGDRDMCMSVENWSPDGATDSIYVLRGGDADAVRFNLSKDESGLTTSVFDEPVATAGQTNVVSLLSREEGAGIASVEFSACN